MPPKREAPYRTIVTYDSQLELTYKDDRHGRAEMVQLRDPLELYVLEGGSIAHRVAHQETACL